MCTIAAGLAAEAVFVQADGTVTANAATAATAMLRSVFRMVFPMTHRTRRDG
jgi:hypothetical protein